MRLVIVVAALGAGGAERVISLLTREWSKAGDDVTVIAFDAPGDPIYHSFDPRVQIVRLGPVRRGGLPAVAVKILRLRACLHRLQPDVVVGFLTKINVMLLLATIGLRVKVIIAERNNPLRQGAHPAWNLLLGRLYPRADAIILQTEASRECLPATVKDHAKIIANPIEVGTARTITSQTKILAGVGRLEVQKGFDRLIDAFAEAASSHLDWSLTIWGEGPERGKLAAQIERLGMTHRITLAGVSATPGGWLDTASAFTLSSRFEGFPNALGEAMANGLPVVAFDCPYGPGEMINDGINGLLVAESDREGYRSALIRIMSSATLRASLGSAAALKSEMYGIGPTIDRWKDAIDDVNRTPPRE